MKLGFALFRYFPYGGLQRDMVAIAEEAVRRGHEVTVFTRDWRGERPPQLNVETLPVTGLTNHARDRRFARALAARAKSQDRLVGFNKMPGLDFYYAADGCLAARYARHPGRWLPRYRARLTLERAVFAPDAATRILSISPLQQRLYQSCYRTPRERFHELPPGIRRDRVVPDDYAEQRRRQRAALGLAEHQTQCLFVGSGFRTKGLARAIHAFARHDDPHAVFHVIGDDNIASYRKLARRLGVGERVIFMGGQDNIPQWLWGADLLLHPAHAENTGTVLLEAAVAGLPVVTTDACGYAPRITGAGMGEVLAAEGFSVAAMNDAMGRILSVPRSDWVERGRGYAESADIFSLVRHAVDAITGEAT